MHRYPLRVLVILVTVTSLAACGTKRVEEAELEEQVKSSLTQQIGQAPKAIDCPGDLDAEVGATQKCVLTADDNSTVDVNVKVTSVQDDKALFDIQVADKVNP